MGIWSGNLEWGVVHFNPSPNLETTVWTAECSMDDFLHHCKKQRMHLLVQKFESYLSELYLSPSFLPGLSHKHSKDIKKGMD